MRRKEEGIEGEKRKDPWKRGRREGGGRKKRLTHTWFELSV